MIFISSNTVLDVIDIFGAQSMIEIKNLEIGVHVQVLCLNPATGTKSYVPILGCGVSARGVLTQSLYFGSNCVFTCAVGQTICTFTSVNSQPVSKAISDLNSGDLIMVSTGPTEFNVLPFSSFTVQDGPRQDVYDLVTSCHYPFFAGIVLIPSDLKNPTS